MYTVKNVYCKKELSWTKYILKKVASVGKIYIIKMQLDKILGGQNMYCKEQLRWTKYKL